MNRLGCGSAEVRSHGVIVDRAALHAELDDFIDEVCRARPRVDEGIVHSLTIEGGVCLFGDLSRARQLTIDGDEAEDYYAQLTATRRVMREVG